MQPKSYAHAPRISADPEVHLDDLVPGKGPLLLEIGAGRGRFTVDYAAQNPGHRVLALEVRRKYAALLADRLAARGLGNVRCFAEDAREVLPRLGPHGAVRLVAVHFPDP